MIKSQPNLVIPWNTQPIFTPQQEGITGYDHGVEYEYTKLINNVDHYLSINHHEK